MVDVTPSDLTRLLDVGERPRTDGWSLRAALTRFGQPRAQLAAEVTEVLRRIEGALKPHAKAADADVDLVPLLRVAADLDVLADELAEWAADITRERPDAAVEAAVADLARRLDDLGVPREDGPPRPGRRRGV